MIPGILFSYDPQLALAELVHKQYRTLWPDMPVRFRVPDNGGSSAAHDYFRGQADCKLIRCSSPMSETAEALLVNIDETAWVFWCIDDRFPVLMDQQALAAIFAALTSLPAEVEEVKFIRPRGETFEGEAKTVGGLPMKVQRTYRPMGFYHHHLIRVGVLRRALVGLPDLDSIHDRILKWPWRGGEAWLSTRTLLSLEEPMVDGELTRNGVEWLQRRRCVVPPYPTRDDVVTFETVQPG